MSQRKPLSDRFLEEVQNTTPTLKLPWNNGEKIPFWRLDDDEHFLVRRQSVAIEEDYGLLMRLNSGSSGDERLSLGQARSALTKLAGPSAQSFDNFKQSFCFPFLHGVPADRPTTIYLMTVHDIRGSLYFLNRRVVAKDDPRIEQHLLHKPFLEELNREELNLLAATMYGYLKGFSEHIIPRPFVEKVDSQQIVYGYADGNYFEEVHVEEDAYEAAIDKWRRIVAALT